MPFAGPCIIFVCLPAASQAFDWKVILEPDHVPVVFAQVGAQFSDMEYLSIYFAHAFATNRAFPTPQQTTPQNRLDTSKVHWCPPRNLINVKNLISVKTSFPHEMLHRPLKYCKKQGKINMSQPWMQFVCWWQAQGELNRLLAHLPELSPSTLNQRFELDTAKNKQPLRLVLQALKGGNESPQEDMLLELLPCWI